jgi:hypothetical protein
MDEGNMYDKPISDEEILMKSLLLIDGFRKKTS